VNTQPTTQPTTQNTDATLMSFAERLRLSGLSLWEMGDLLGIHPHLLRGHSLSRLRDLPVSALIEIARRLDLHPADLIPELADVLGNQRKPPAPSHDGGPHDVEADARTVLTALATAAVPLAPDALAAALTWQLPRGRPPSPTPKATPALPGRWPYGGHRLAPSPSHRGWTCSPKSNTAPSPAPPTTTAPCPRPKASRCCAPSPATGAKTRTSTDNRSATTTSTAAPSSPSNTPESSTATPDPTASSSRKTSCTASATGPVHRPTRTPPRRTTDRDSAPPLTTFRRSHCHQIGTQQLRHAGLNKSCTERSIPDTHGPSAGKLFEAGTQGTLRNRKALAEIQQNYSS
jgi:hypothetical protein